ncbi:unnamed protein product [Thelazia callipaeda]|uniref:Zinc_ribbon_16 domain-containing protein n=1 Tax=Thelazia callipaeda TaxID=103827 RepID=A0A158RD12_THECL|nr:unnamed protein product [Thelazia callipaeda]
MFRDIRWLSNHRRQFVAISIEQIALYEDVDKCRPKLLHCLPFNQNSEEERLQSFDLSPLSDEALALGYANGKVVLSKVAAEPVMKNLNYTVELARDVRRAVTFLNFSPIMNVHLAACFERGRSQDYTVCVYDVSNPKLHVFCVNCSEDVTDQTWLKDSSSMLCLGCSRSIKFFDLREGSRPVCSFSVSNQVRSISAGDVHLCIACIIEDYAYIYDRRHLTSPIYKLPVSYFRKNDTGAVKILWNPYFTSSLTCFRRNGRVITEFMSSSENTLDEHGITELASLSMTDTVDMVQSGFRRIRYSEDSGSIKLSHPYLELNHKVYGVSRVSGFSWHPEKRDRLLVVAPDGGRGAFEIRLTTMCRFVTGDYSSQGFLAHAFGTELYIRNADSSATDISPDISFVMKNRAAKNFGAPSSITLEAYVQSCKEIIDNCPYSSFEMKWLWKWMRRMICIVDWRPCVYKTLFPGVIDLMQCSLNPESEELTTERIFVIDPFLGRIRLYRGKERNRVLRICGWPALGDLTQLDMFIEENLMERETQNRAIAAALITANSTRIKKILNLMLEKAKNSSEELLEVETLKEALQHYRGISEQWRSSSERLKSIVKDPYLSMVITFLDGHCDNFSSLQCIIHQKDIPLEDRIAFAAIHLSDQYFMKSMRELFIDACLYRKLSGLFIVGISSEKATHDLLSQYVDHTGDIQTAAVLLAIGQCFVKDYFWPSTYTTEEIASSDFQLFMVEEKETVIEENEYMKRSCAIVIDYMDMLNTWGMWIQRARLDCVLGWRRDSFFFKSKMKQSVEQVEICCQFCPQNITMGKADNSSVPASSSVLVPTTRSLAKTSSASSSITLREMACPHCLKPLPKCILCHRHMGAYVQTECRDLGRLSSWFTWCQKCRHGGHLAHLRHWFSEHEECAASGCLCNCKGEGSMELNTESSQTCKLCEDL